MQHSKKDNWQPLRELALKTPYTMEYLSLMARRRELKVKKVGRLWYSTVENIKEFENARKERKEKRKSELRDSFYEKSGMKRKPLKVAVLQKTIFDQVQDELEEVLTEIRKKERRLRAEYHARMSNAQYQISNEKETGHSFNSVARGANYGITNRDGFKKTPSLVGIPHFAKGAVGADREGMGNSPESFNGPQSAVRSSEPSQEKQEEYLQKEQQETEELSEKLIMDLGKLLNTANKVHDDVEKNSGYVPEETDPKSEAVLPEESYSIPINRANVAKMEEMASSQDNSDLGAAQQKMGPYAMQNEEAFESVGRNGRNQEWSDENKKHSGENHAPFLSLNYPYRSQSGDAHIKRPHRVYSETRDNLPPERFQESRGRYEKANYRESDRARRSPLFFFIAGIGVFLIILFVLIMLYG